MKCKACRKPFVPQYPLQSCCSIGCAIALKGNKAEVAKRKPIKPMSDKRKEESKEYTVLRKKFLELNPICQARFEHCTFNATDIHHIARRGKNYLNTDTFAALCRWCHTYIETNPAWARSKGWLK